MQDTAPKTHSRDRTAGRLAGRLTASEIADLDTTAALVRYVDAERYFAFNPSGDWVYILWGDTDTPIYIGETGDLLNRLGWHAGTEKRAHIRSVQLLRCRSVAERKETERRLIDFYEPIFNLPIGGRGSRRVPNRA